MKNFLRNIRRLLRGGRSDQTTGDTFAFQRRAFYRAQLVVASFYAGNLLWAGWELQRHTHWDNFKALVPLWPLRWATNMDVADVTTLLLSVNILVAVVAVMFSHSRAARWLAFAGVFFTCALSNSFGRIGHSGHVWVWVAFFFAWLPSATPAGFASSRLARQRYLQVFWTAQFAVLFFYSIAGGLKVASAPVQWLHGQAGAFGPEALARHIANRMIQTQSEPLLGAWLVEHVAVSWPLYLGALYVEALAVFAAFRPALHRWWGAGLILMHLGIGVGMEIWFVPPLFVLALLMVNSPFAPPDVGWREALRQLPGVAIVYQLLGTTRRREPLAPLGVAPLQPNAYEVTSIGVGD